MALVCSAHGFGHVGRQLALAEALLDGGAEVDLWTAAPPEVVRSDVPGAGVVPWTVDVGIVQRDSRSEDVAATVARAEALADDARVDALAAALRGYDRVVVDVAPAGLEAARRARVPAVAVGNFDWPWIYAHYPVLRGLSRRLAAWQAPHPGWSLGPGPGLRGFASVRPFGWLGRRRPARRVAERAVLVAFGGLGLADVEAWLPRLDGVTWVLAAPMPAVDRPDVVRVEGGSFPALVAGADVVLTKPGYGLLAEAALAGTRLVWIDRGAFPEAPWLEAAMRARGDRKVDGRDVAGAVRARLADPPPPPVASDVAATLAGLLRSDRPIG